MKLAHAFVRLPVRFDAEALAAELAANISEADWRPHPQGYEGNSALPLVAVDGDPSSDAVSGHMRPTPHLLKLPYFQQVMASFGAPIGRSRLMRLHAESEATPHVDVNYYWLQRTRIHVPIVTKPTVTFLCDDAAVHMPAGDCWVFDTFRLHNVLNPNEAQRIHLVIDTVGSAAFWDKVADGDPVDDSGQDVPAARAQLIVPGAVTTPLTFESVNTPEVMSPWELRELADLMASDIKAPDSPDADRVLDLLDRIAQDWHGLWARFGDSATGRPAFKQLAAAGKQALAGAPVVAMRNGRDVAGLFTTAVLDVAVRSAPAVASSPPPHAPAGAEPAIAESDSSPVSVDKTVAAAVVPPASVRAIVPRGSAAVRSPVLVAPTFIVSAPRSGSTMLFEALSQAPAAWSIGGESHQLIEGVPELSPAAHGWDSNSLTAADATPETVGQLTARFIAQAIDRSGSPLPDGLAAIRLVEKTPKNSLRIPFLQAAYPDARFVYLHRDPVDTIDSMFRAWESKRFVTYANLPGWTGPDWSLLLVPGWADLAGRPMLEIVAHQWARTADALLDSLEALNPESWSFSGYADVLEDPQAELMRLAEFAGLGWDRELPASLPPSRTTLTAPAPDKWRERETELLAVLPLVATTVDRVRTFAAEHEHDRRKLRRAAKAPVQLDAGPTGLPIVLPPVELTTIAPEPITSPESVAPESIAALEPVTAESLAHEGIAAMVEPTAQATEAKDPATEPANFSSVHTTSFPELLESLAASLIVTTYQSGRLVVLRPEGKTLNTHFVGFESPMGVAVGPGRFALGTKTQVWDYRNQPAVAPKVEPVGTHDAAYLPRSAHWTGDIRIHELAYVGDELWFMSTLFSCLATRDKDHSFVPRWRPPFVSALAPEDRCHLNGMALRDGEIKYVTALGVTDTAGGWRENKLTGGVLLEVPSGKILAEGLCMPHSPRWHAGRLWVLESGHGGLSYLDPETGKIVRIAELPGFTRGLAFSGPYAFVGLSQVRESVFAGLPIVERTDRACGVWVVDIRNGQTVAFLRFEGVVEEVFDVQLLPHRFPTILEPGHELINGSYVLPDDALRDVPDVLVAAPN